MDRIANAEKNIDDAKVRHAMERQRLNQQLRLAKDAKKKEREREKQAKKLQTMPEEHSTIAKLIMTIEQLLKEIYDVE